MNNGLQRSLFDWGGNIVAFVLMVAVNGMSNSIPIGGRTQGDISALYPSLFTPAAYAFSIWGLIYLLLLGFVIYQALPAQRSDHTLAKISSLFKANCFANLIWLIVWHYDYLFLSLALMVCILLTLIVIYRSLEIPKRSDSLARRLLIQLPFSLYLGWISVAIIANISILQTAMNWDDVGFDAVTWTLLKLALAGAVGATIVLWRRDYAFVLVTAWAAYAISVKQVSTPAVSGAATVLAVLALLLAILELIRRAKPDRSTTVVGL